MSKSYKLGYHVELLCKQKLNEMGFTAIRSSRSLTPVDIVAINPEWREIWLVQVKREDAPADYEKLKGRFTDLHKLGGTYIVKTFVYMRKKGKYSFIELL